MLNAASKSIGARTHSPRGQGARGTTLTSRRQVAVTAIRKPNAADLKDNFRRGPLDGIGTYVSEAFAQIFSGTAESVPWCVEIPVMTRLSLSLSLSISFSSPPQSRTEARSRPLYDPWPCRIEQPAFSGSLRHHEFGARHGHSHPIMSPEGDFGTKYQAIVEDGGVAGDGPLGWVTDTVGRSFFGANLNEQSSEPRKFYSTGYTGRVASARKIRRDVDRLGRH